MLRARRAFLLVFALGIVTSLITMFWTARALSADEERTEATAELLGLVFFRATRTFAGDTSTVSLRPGIGVFVILIVLPAIAAAVVYSRRRWGGGQVSTA